MGTPDKANFSLPKLLAVCATFTYFFLATYRIDFQSIWYDEGLTLHYASLPLLDGLGELAKHSVHPPLYFGVMHFWLIAAGDSDFSLRLLSSGFGTLLIAASFTLGARLANPRLGAILACVTATSPFVVYYGQEARMYTAVAFLCMLSTLGAIDIARRRKGFFFYGVTSGLAIYTHYFAFLVLGCQALVLAPLLLLRRRTSDLATWTGTLVLVGLAFMPWGMNLFKVASSHEDFWREKMSLSAMLQDSVLHFSLGEVAWSDNYLVYVFYAAAFAGMLGLFRPSLRPAVGASTVALLASYSALAVFPKATYVSRYMLVFAPAFYLLVAAGIYNLGGFIQMVQPKRDIGLKVGGSVLAALALTLTLMVGASNTVSLLTGYFSPSSFRREDVRALAGYLEPKLRPQDGLVFVAGPLNYALFHYLPADAPSVWVDSNVKLKADDSLPELESFLQNESLKRVWLVRSLVSADDLVDPDRVTQERILEKYGIITAIKDERGLIAEAYDRVLYDRYKARTRLNITFGDQVSLTGYSLGQGRISRGSQLDVELYWEPSRKVTQLLWVSLQLIDSNTGAMVALADFPAGGLVPTTTWAPGMKVADKAQLSIPVDVPSAKYEAFLVVYDPTSNYRLGVSSSPQGQQIDTIKLFDMQIEP